MLIVWFRLYLQQSLIQNTMQTTKREARRNSVNIMDNKHGVGDIICHAHIFLPKCDTSYLGHDETSSGHDVSHMHLTQIASLRTLTEPFRFSRFNIITNASTNKKLTGAWGCEFGVVNRRTKLRPDSRLDLVNST